MSDGGGELARAFREDRAAALAAVARRVRDLDVAEDAVAEAFARAVVAWERDGVPRSPRGWLVTTAWRSAVDQLRAARSQGGLVEGLGDRSRPAPVALGRAALSPLDDDLLRLVLLCCHPALAPAAQVALTLRCVAGLDTPALARVLLCEEATAAQRVVRAKRKVRDAGVPFSLPAAADLADRLVPARAVVHLLLTEGHAPTRGDEVVSPDVCEEAVWLARLLHRLAPDDVETAGLLALCLLVHARTPARTDADGEAVLLPEQDRARWAADLRAEGLDLLATGRRGRLPGRYWLEAEIAGVHARAADDTSTDWPRLAGLYAALAHLTRSPAVEVNRAVAVGRADGPPAGLAVLSAVIADGRLAAWAPLHAAHAELLDRADRPREASAAWRQALELTRTAPHRRALTRRLEASAARTAGRTR